MDSSAQAPVRSRAGRRVLIALAALAFALVALELGWRVWLQRTGRGFFDDPSEFTSPFFTTYEEPRPLLAAGGFQFHNGWVAREKAPGEIRVICFGGSTTVDWRAGISYPQILEERLKDTAEGRSVRVLNAGGDGFSSAHTLVNLALRNLDVRPDVITVYHNINDLSVRRFGEEVLSDYGNKYKTDFYLGMRHRTGALAALTKVSRLARHAVSSFHALRFPEEEQRSHPHEIGLRYFEANLRSIVVLARAHGIRPVLATQAARTDVREAPDFAAYNDAVRRIAREEGVELIDVAAAVTDDSLFLPDGIHCTRAGVEAVAAVFQPPLVRLVGELARDAAR
ncbi:MAG TPA: GDSL-type esterase/lipase family protein [Planctomycetota bacterium]|nr:GDSL-type esterase/lipase family protein [Planctomycetota bacterium]